MCRWCAWDSNPWWQDGRRSQIHWAMAPQLKYICLRYKFVVRILFDGSLAFMVNGRFLAMEGRSKWMKKNSGIQIREKKLKLFLYRKISTWNDFYLTPLRPGNCTNSSEEFVIVLLFLLSFLPGVGFEPFHSSTTVAHIFMTCSLFQVDSTKLDKSRADREIVTERKMTYLANAVNWLNFDASKAAHLLLKTFQWFTIFVEIIPMADETRIHSFLQL